jgi:hypothetical protein
MFLLSFWVGSALRFAFVGIGCGGILGLLGSMTRWENQPDGLFYTPSPGLALIVTFAIAARFITAGGVLRAPAAALALPVIRIG